MACREDTVNPTQIQEWRRFARVVGTPEHFRWLHGISKCLLVLNLFDGILTVLWIQLSYAREWNVFMRGLAHSDLVLFMLVKLAVVSLGTLFLWRNRHHPLAIVAIFLAFSAYYLVLLYHIQYLTIFFL